jgi:hypothetical protein
METRNYVISELSSHAYKPFSYVERHLEYIQVSKA